MVNQTIDTEYIILENIYDSGERNSALRQRDLAQIAGTSLGMTNSILKRLAQKGWITIKKLNSRNIQYAVTLEGINEIIHRSYHYFKRTIKNAVFYKDSLEEVIRSAKARETAAVILVGVSDLDFIVEHACRHYGLSFLKTTESETAGKAGGQNTLRIYAESISENSQDAGNCLYLSRLVMKQAAAVR
ncbi:MAG: MarR family transcriptional regulator [Treponema sp.]|jgi:DNA-binding MarR family transcriptional regulator|nr:MarR family transcriptional regulator [Treponema sp.]